MSSTQLTTPHAVRPRAGTRRAARAITDAPWAPADRLVTAVMIAVGVLLIGVAWFGASDTTDWDTQLGWTALSMIGVVVVCIGVGIWLFRGLSRVRDEARAVRRALALRLAEPAASAAEIDLDQGRVTVAGMAHHHRSDCLLVSGKSVVAADEATLSPCGVCG